VREERGFTLIELMVVVLIIAILIAMAIPTFLSARTRAQDRAVQSNLRNALTAERVVYTDAQAFTSDPAMMTPVEPSFVYVDGDTPSLTNRVYLHVHPSLFDGELFISAKSASGRCFYIRERPSIGTAYASSTNCGVADTQTYLNAW
jgi:type IV pilus assembly protein PilA